MEDGDPPQQTDDVVVGLTLRQLSTMVGLLPGEKKEKLLENPILGFTHDPLVKARVDGGASIDPNRAALTLSGGRLGHSPLRSTWPFRPRRCLRRSGTRSVESREGSNSACTRAWSTRRASELAARTEHPGGRLQQQEQSFFCLDHATLHRRETRPLAPPLPAIQVRVGGIYVSGNGERFSDMVPPRFDPNASPKALARKIVGAGPHNSCLLSCASGTAFPSRGRPGRCTCALRSAQTKAPRRARPAGLELDGFAFAAKSGGAASAVTTSPAAREVLALYCMGDRKAYMVKREEITKVRYPRALAWAAKHSC